MGKDDRKIKSSGVDNTFRRTWDKDEFREKAKEREQVRAEVALLLALPTPRAVLAGLFAPRLA